jgi:hypothetical protein
MSSLASPDSLIAVGRRHWRTFLPIWLFPVVVFLAIFVPWRSTHLTAFFWFEFVVLGVCMYIAGSPRRQGLATWSQTMFWAVIVPFLIWGIIVGGIFGLALALGAV